MTDELTLTTDNQTRDGKLRALRDSIRKGEYQVDSQRTAEAMIEQASATVDEAEESNQ